jgi:hypothetical protein
MKFKPLRYLILPLFLFTKISLCLDKSPSITTSGEICALTHSLNPGLNCNSAGCLNVPQNNTKSTNPPLLYIRGLKQDPAPRTEDLFTSQYNLGKLNQIVFATASSDIKISKKDLQCLQDLNTAKKIDVASHSGGYIGLEKNSDALKGNVNKLYLLDNFYNPEAVKNSVLTINPDQCSGFTTSHNLQRYNQISSNIKKCTINQDTGHVTGVIKTLSKKENLYSSNDTSRAIASEPVPRGGTSLAKTSSHGQGPTQETLSVSTPETNFDEYTKNLSDAQDYSKRNNNQRSKDNLLAFHENVTDQYIHRSVQSLGCSNFKDALLFNGSRLASLNLNEASKKNIILGDSKKLGLLSRLNHNIVGWCRNTQGLKGKAANECEEKVFSILKDFSENFYKNNSSYQRIKQISQDPNSDLSKKISELERFLNSKNIKCNREESLNVFSIKNEKAKPSGKYSDKPPRDSLLKAKIIRAARETVKLSKEESVKARNGLSSNSSRGVFGRMRDKISSIFAGKEGDVIDSDLIDPHNNYENARSRSLCYRYTHIALASAGLTDKWLVRPPGYAKDATRDFIPNLKKVDGTPYFSEQVSFLKGNGPTVRTDAANKLMLSELSKDKEGVYVVVYDNPSTPGHIGTVFYNEDKKQWEEYSDYMAPVFGQSSRSNGQTYRYGGRASNKIKAIYKLNDDKNGEQS